MPAILIVDDDAMVRDRIQKALRQAGHDATAIGTGAEAIAFLQRRVPDLVLLDIVMPLADGLSTLRAIRRNPHMRSVPVIMLTNAADRGSVAAAAGLGVSGYLLKSSSSPHDVVRQVERTLSTIDPMPATEPVRLLHAEEGAMREESAPTTSISTPARGEKAATAPTGVVALARTPVAQLPKNASASAIQCIAPIASMSSVAAALEQCDEPKGFSPTVSEVLKLTSSATCAIESVARAISHDAAMALRILRLANSVVYARGERLNNVTKAVLRIGLGQIRIAVMNMAIIDRFSTESLGSIIDLNHFWEHSIATGILAVEIARSRGDKDTDIAFTMGVLHDVGRLVILEQLPAEYTRVLEVARTQQLPLEDVERRMLGCTHASVMEQMLRRWQFVSPFTVPITMHHFPTGTGCAVAPRITPHTVALALANRLAHSLMLGSSGNDTIYPTVELCEHVQLASDVLDRIVRTAQEETGKVKLALLACSESKEWMPMQQSYRRRLDKPMRPLFFSAKPGLDACRLLCEHLTQPDEHNPPNIAVIHARTDIELSAMIDRLRNAEQRGALGSLPLIAISPMSTLDLEYLRRGNRCAAVLPMPFAIEQFLVAVNALL